MKIWIYLNGMQQGPYDFNQLSQMPLTEQTPVWYDGLPQWTPAGQAPATASLFANAQGANAAQATPQAQQMPPVINITMQQAPKQPPTYIGWSIVLTILCCSFVALLAIVTGAISSSRYNAGDYNGAKTMSTLTEWLLIIAIVFSVISVPLGFASFMV